MFVITRVFVNGVGLVEPCVFQRLTVQERPGIRRCERHLNRMRIDFGRESNRLFDRFLCFAGQTEDERPVDRDAEIVAILGKEPREFDAQRVNQIAQPAYVQAVLRDNREQSSSDRTGLRSAALSPRSQWALQGRLHHAPLRRSCGASGAAT